MINSRNTLLIIDDDTFILDIYAQKFMAIGWTVRTARGAKDAFEQLRDKNVSFDVVLIDMFMPTMDGVSFLEEMKTLALDRGMKKIILSNEGEDEYIEKAENVGIDGYIVKSLMTPQEVVEYVRSSVKNTT